MTRRSARRPAPKKQDESNVYYDDELSDVFEDPIDDNDDDSDEDPTFEADDDAFEDPSYDEPLEEEEEDDAPLSLGAKRKAFSSNDFSSQPSKLQRTYTPDSGWTGNPQPHVPHSMSASFRLNTPTPPMQAGRPTSYFASNQSTGTSSYPSPGGGSGASITSCPPPLSQPNPSMSQQGYPQQNPTSYPGSNFSGENRSGQGSGGYPYRSPLQGRTPTAQQQHAASAYAAYSNRGMSGYPQMGSQHTPHSNYPPAMNASSYGGGYPNSGYPPQQSQQQQAQNPRFNGGGNQPVPHPAEYRVRELLSEHHTRSKMQGVPHDVSLAQLKREISNDPDLIEALKLIRLRASQRGNMQPRPGMPFGHTPPPGGMHRTFGSNMYGQNQMQSGNSGQGEMSNATIPASMRNAMSVNRFHSSYGVPAQNYQVTGGMGMPMHGQAPQMAQYAGQNLHAGYGQYNQGQPGSMMPSPMVKQTLNAEMANSLMQQTAGSGPDASNGLDASTDNAGQQDDLGNLSGTEKRIETIMRKCEGISRQLRESLQKHLKSLLDDGKTEDQSEEGGDGEESKTGQPLSTISMESILRSSTDTLQKSKEEQEAAGNGKTETSTLDEDLEQAMEENKSETDHADYYIVREQPSILRFALKEYQLVGLNWLNLLHLENVNGILADEMGLGKTIQTISLFALLHERKTSKHPHIVICPVTTLTNWMRELQKWCPNLRVIAYYGKKAERDEARKIIGNEHFDVIITTYNTAAQKSDRLFLKRNKFDYVVLDEAQNIKNNQSLRHKYLAKLDSRNRLLLTGTPLQNNLEELWALLQFIMPDLFSSEVNLEEETDKELAERLVSRMKVIMAPFVLRRLKQHVSQDLPAKELKIIECPMTDLQRDLYRACVQQSKTWWQKNQSTDTTSSVKEEPEEEEEDFAKSTLDTDSFLSEDVVGTKTTDDTPSATETAPAADAEVKSESTAEEATATPKTEPSQIPVKPKKEETDDFMPEDEGESSDDEVPDEDDEAYTGTKSKVALPASSRKTRSRAQQSDDEDDELQLHMRGTPASSVSSMNNIFMQLRKISNHPLLVRAFYTDEQVVEIARYLSSLDDYRKQTVDRIFEDLQEYSDFRIHQLCKDKEPLHKFLLNNEKLESCGKALQLKAVLAELKQKGHRVLLFSQMTRVLSILEDLITMWGYQYVRLDGNTPVTERQVLIDRYNDEPDTLFIFLLSTRAGGVGINLTSADTVIFYDIAFNPQVDRQAEDRCHRLGQSKEVTIYKMITTETVDEHMLRMADRKAQLNDVMLEEGSKKKDNTKVWALRSLLSSVFE